MGGIVTVTTLASWVPVEGKPRKNRAWLLWLRTALMQQVAHPTPVISFGLTPLLYP